MKPVDQLMALERKHYSEPNQNEAGEVKKWREAADKALATGKMANTLAKALASRFSYRWQFIDFLGQNGRESAGIVDILAIRKSGKPPLIDGLKRLDKFDMQLIQVKGGSAPLPNSDEIRRLRIVQQYYRADRVVLFQWIKGKTAMFSTLGDDGDWHETTASALFGRKS